MTEHTGVEQTATERVRTGRAGAGGPFNESVPHGSSRGDALARVAVAKDELTGALLVSLLEAKGIPAVVMAGHLSSIVGGMATSADVCVRRADHARASGFLRAFSS